jgi:ABC-type dipeptide/oligopeptide/nickel transport system ATPase component
VGDLAGRSVDTLSGGEWQRVRVARALAQEPEVLVLDEPTASLDVRHEMELFELIRHLVNGGLAGLVITHHINLAARFADHMVLLDRGRIAAEGPPAEVLRREVLDRVSMAGGGHPAGPTARPRSFPCAEAKETPRRRLRLPSRCNFRDASSSPASPERPPALLLLAAGLLAACADTNAPAPAPEEVLLVVNTRSNSLSILPIDPAGSP